MIEMADKKQKRKTSAEQKKAYTVSTVVVVCRAAPHQLKSVYTGWLLKIIWNERGSRLLSGSSVDSIISDYNEFYSILSRRTAHVRCRHGVTIRQEVGPV